MSRIFLPLATLKPLAGLAALALRDPLAVNAAGIPAWQPAMTSLWCAACAIVCWYGKERDVGRVLAWLLMFAACGFSNRAMRDVLTDGDYLWWPIEWMWLGALVPIVVLVAPRAAVSIHWPWSFILTAGSLEIGGERRPIATGVAFEVEPWRNSMLAKILRSRSRRLRLTGRWLSLVVAVAVVALAVFWDGQPALALALYGAVWIAAGRCAAMFWRGT